MSVIRKHQALLMALLLGSLAAVPLFLGQGIVNTRAGGDSPFLIMRLQQLATVLRAGVFPPRWMPDAAYGYGYPFFNHYAALPYYIAAAFKFLGWGYLASIKLTQALGFLAAVGAMFGLLRAWTKDERCAFLGAIAYGYAPFHLVNVYVRGDSLSEFYAFVFFPLILWSLYKLRQTLSWRSAALVALSYGGLLLTHNVSALILSPFIALYVLFLVWRADGRPWRWIGLSAAGLMLGLAVSAWFWWPAFMERNLGHMADMTTGYFNYSGHFRGLNLVQTTLSFDYGVTADKTPFAMGLFQAALATLGLLALLWAAARKRMLPLEITFSAVTLIVSTWLITPLSEPLWAKMPLLQMAQFPWRFLSIQALAAALVIAWLPLSLARVKKAEASPKRIGARFRASRWPVWALGGLFALTSLWSLHPERLHIDESDINQETLRLYELFTSNIGTTVRYEYLPMWVDERPYTSEALINGASKGFPLVAEGELTGVALQSIRPNSETWQVDVASESALVAFQTYYFPGWRAYLDGLPAQVGPMEGLGYIQMRLPSGQHLVELEFGATSSRTIAETVSLAAALALLGLLLARSNRRGILWGAASAASIIGVIALLGWLWPVAEPPAGALSDLTMDFARQPYLHHNPGGVTFGAQARLLGYHLSNERLWAGDPLTVELQWQGPVPEGLEAELRLVSPSEPLFGTDDPLAVLRLPLKAGVTDYALQVPERTLPGIYLLSVQVWSGGEEVLPVNERGETLGTPYLAPIYVLNTLTAEAPSEAIDQFGECIQLVGADATQDGQALAVDLDWQATCRPLRNAKLSLRLLRDDGHKLAALDIQPDYGFYPTSFWKVGQLIPLRAKLPIPEGTPPGSSYALEVVLYDPATLEAIGAARVPGITLTEPTIKTAYEPIYRFGELDLAAFDLAPSEVEEGGVAVVAFTWAAGTAPSRDYVYRLALRDEAGHVAWEEDAPLAAEYPTSEWPQGAFISSEASLQGLPPGTYEVTLELRDAKTTESYGAYVAPTQLVVKGRARSFEAPSLQVALAVSLGDQIELLGYDLQRDEAKLSVVLYWRALANIQADYKVFVHLFDPATERIAWQYDGIPQGGAYPTSLWAAGEVVQDPIEIPLAGVPSGTYRLGVGLYDPSTMARLTARAEGLAEISADRVLLPDKVDAP